MNQESDIQQLKDIWLDAESRKLLYSKLRDHSHTLSLVNEICHKVPAHRLRSRPAEQIAAIIMNMLRIIDDLESRNGQLAFAHIRAELDGVDVFETQGVLSIKLSVTAVALMQTRPFVLECELLRQAEKMVKSIAESAEKMQAEARKQADGQPQRPTCKVCGNMADEVGIIEHGRGCYMADADGGGYTYVGDDT